MTMPFLGFSPNLLSSDFMMSKHLSSLKMSIHFHAKTLKSNNLEAVVCETPRFFFNKAFSKLSESLALLQPHYHIHQALQGIIDYFILGSQKHNHLGTVAK